MTKREKAANVFEDLMNQIKHPMRLGKEYYLSQVENPNSNMVALVYYAFSILRNDIDAVSIKGKFKMDATPEKLDELLCEYSYLLWND